MPSPGMTNRWLARFATQVLEAFPGQLRRRRRRPRTIGNPVRADIAAIAPPAERFAGREPRARLLVFGGSQGAQRLNAVLPQALGARSRPALCRRCVIRPASADSRRRAPRMREAAVEAEVLALHRRHGQGLCLGGSCGVPRRRHDGGRTAGGGLGRGVRAACPSPPTIIKPRTPKSWCAAAPRA